MKKVTSTSNEFIKHIASLGQHKNRAIHKQFVAEGIRSISTLKNNGFKPIAIIITTTLFESAVNLNLDYSTQLLEVNESVMNKISTAASPSGIVGLFSIPENPSHSITTPSLALANISDPGNMGTLIRTATALGFKNIIIIEGVDCWNPKVIQASAGTIGLIPLFRLSWTEFIAHTALISRCALVVQGGKKSQAIDLKNQILIVGNEAHGIPEQWLADCNQHLTLSVDPTVESLNAAVAGSIAMYLTIM